MKTQKTKMKTEKMQKRNEKDEKQRKKIIQYFDLSHNQIALIKVFHDE